MMQQQLGFDPIALHGPLGDSAQGRNLAKREAAKELQVDQLRERRIERDERLQGFIEIVEIR